jgi:AcrR family transcriptional regulator
MPRPTGRRRADPYTPAAMGDTRSRILDAALVVIARDGLTQLSLEDVAREAGVSRQTVYRHMGSREGLVSETILREEESYLARLEAAMHPHQAFEAALRAGILEALRLAREHPLLDRSLSREPEALLPFLSSGEGPVLPAARQVVARLLRTRAAHLDEPTIAMASDAITRMMISYAISPAQEPPEEVATRLARIIAHGISPAR